MSQLLNKLILELFEKDLRRTDFSDCSGSAEILPRTEFGIENSVAKANYLAVVDAEVCTGCGVCTDRCQVNAVTRIDGVAVVDENSCIGCGLCSTTCESDAMHLERKPDAGIVAPPVDKQEWGKQRLRNRGLL